VVDHRLPTGIVDDPLEYARLTVDLTGELVERSLDTITTSDGNPLGRGIIDDPGNGPVKRIILQSRAHPL
jgi:hypothetical protein